MNNFSLTTQLTQQEYCKLFLQLSYKQRVYQIITMMGILLLILSIIRFFIPNMLTSKVQLFLLCFSIYTLVLFPVLIWLRSKKIYKTNLALQEAIHYQFSDENVIVNGGGIESVFAWKDFGKVQQTKSFLLLYNYNRAAYFIKLKDLTQEQINFIKLKMNNG
ncbi:MAG: YcxB family protein [Arachidicoccus sp.]|nr:YcxB family protein [Arachidicoccus sp.]